VSPEVKYEIDVLFHTRKSYSDLKPHKKVFFFLFEMLISDKQLEN